MATPLDTIETDAGPDIVAHLVTDFLADKCADWQVCIANGEILRKPHLWQQLSILGLGTRTNGLPRMRSTYGITVRGTPEPKWTLWTDPPSLSLDDIAVWASLGSDCNIVVGALQFRQLDGAGIRFHVRVFAADPAVKLMEQVAAYLRDLYVQPSGVRGKATVENAAVQRDQPGVPPDKYDVAISFAGAQRPLAKDLATRLQEAGIKVFYDDFYVEQLWGEDLAAFFAKVYRKDSRYCVIFVSQEYLDGVWTIHERRHAVARLIEQKGERYILPIKVDPVDLPDVPPTTGYLAFDRYPIDKIAEILVNMIKADTQSS